MNFQRVIDDHMTKGEAAEYLYPGVTFDCAIPQGWVRAMTSRGFEDSAAHFISLYPTDAPSYIAPITPTGVWMVSIVATYDA